LDIIENKKIPTNDDTIRSVIATLDVDTLKRILDMTHLDIDMDMVVSGLSTFLRRYEENPTDGMKMLKFLDENYDIVGNRFFIYFLMRLKHAIPIIEYLVSTHANTATDMADFATMLLLNATDDADDEVIKYIVEELSPSNSSILELAAKACSCGSGHLANLLEKYSTF
jgi:hypothetical protein